MIGSIFLLFVVIAIVFFLLMIKYESMIFGGLSIFLWFLLAQFILKIEIPYQMVVNNEVVTGTHAIESMYPIAPFFWLMGILALIYLLVAIVLPMLQQKYSKMM